MRLSWNEIRARASHFADEWKDAHYEKGQAQTFYNEFFEVFGVTRRRVASFEEPVKKLDGKHGFIDLFWKGVLLVEQKSAGGNLTKAKRQALDYFPGIKDADPRGRSPDLRSLCGRLGGGCMFLMGRRACRAWALRPRYARNVSHVREPCGHGGRGHHRLIFAERNRRSAAVRLQCIFRVCLSQRIRSGCWSASLCHTGIRPPQSPLK